jgi:hypothetical protein
MMIRGLILGLTRLMKLYFQVDLQILHIPIGTIG